MATTNTSNRRYKRKLTIVEGVRKQGMGMLKRGVKQSIIAAKLGVSRQAVSKWNKSLKFEPIQPWRRKKLGRPSRFDHAQKIYLATSLRKGALAFGFATNKWTLERISVFLNAHNYDYHHYDKACLSRVLKEIGFTCQKPSAEDQRALRRWESMKWIPTKGALVGSERVESYKRIVAKHLKRRKPVY